MIWYIWLIFAWTVFGHAWMILDTIVSPSTWQNFTSWVWFLQTIFFTIHTYDILNPKKEKNGSTQANIFLDCFFLPVLFACEWSTGISVVYMMTVHASLLEHNLDLHGPLITWTANLLVHYITLAMLILYMHFQPRHKIIKNAIAGFQESYYNQIIIFSIFIILFTYSILLKPVKHYGIPEITEFELNFAVVVSGFIGFLVFKGWLQDFEW